jgi:hypothetical protein
MEIFAASQAVIADHEAATGEGLEGGQSKPLP